MVELGLGWPPELGLSAPTRVRALSGTGVSPFFLRVSGKLPRVFKKKSVTIHAKGSIFPSAKKLGGEIVSCWRCIFFNLVKNHGLRDCFGNSWRCSKGERMWGRKKSRTEFLMQIYKKIEKI
jgi:hypothetical protein